MPQPFELSAKIESVSYKPFLSSQLDPNKLTATATDDLNCLPSVFYFNLEQFSYCVSKWVSPKRTRSYPYTRVYNSLNQASKIVTIIPVVKDEGSDGDCDYLAWDTVSFMSLLNIYVIITYYDEAERNIRTGRRPNKITNQRFNQDYIVEQFKVLNKYQSSALHWNIQQVQPSNLARLLLLAKGSYKRISERLGISMHNLQDYDSLIVGFENKVNSFMTASRARSKKAQQRETKTIQPKEVLSEGKKMAINITNYLGGVYYFTVDSVIFKKETCYLIESKHSRSQLLPGKDDIKDGLLKMVLYSNFSSFMKGGVEIPYHPVLRLTSNRIKGKITSDKCNEDELNKKIVDCGLESQAELVKTLFKEGKYNGFSVEIEQASYD